MDPEVLTIPPQTGWDQARNVSDGSLSTSSEQIALIGFAHRLCSVSMNNEPGIAEGDDVRKEARLLMSLSCSSQSNIAEGSGRITPTSDTSSCHSSASRRDSFSFTCPSLSLENRSEALEEEGEAQKKEKSPPPAVLLGRSLKVDDKDALRLSSEAMARNMMQSYQKAIDWRIQAWVDSLCRILLNKEKTLNESNASEEKMKELLGSSEARLVVTLREIAKKIHVIDASTSFKVSAQKISTIEASSKRQRVEEEDEQSGLEEAEYQYHVAHLLSMEVYLNVHTPGAGYIQMDLQIPGTMKGTFLSMDDDDEQLTDVAVDLNTDILASMIEKSSRIVVRASVEALLREEAEEVTKGATEVQAEENMKKSKVEDAPFPTSPPKRKFSEESVSGLVVITPRDISSPSSFGDSDNDDKPIILSIPDNFTEPSKNKLQMLTPQPSRAREVVGNIIFASRLPRKERPLPTVVTPHKAFKPSVEARGKGPSLPTLVEVACAAMQAR